MRIDSSVALITGGGRGLGRAFAFALAEHRVSVAITGRTEAEIRIAAQEIVQAGGRAIAIPGDVTNRQASDFKRSMLQYRHPAAQPNTISR
jgi:NAD(P)-dependent dehydrogenase (short-subunit alcohol dehydrogenase family)